MSAAPRKDQGAKYHERGKNTDPIRVPAHTPPNPTNRRHPEGTYARAP